MKKSLVVTALFVLALAMGGTAVAAVTTQTTVHSYGNSAGQVDPAGTDILGNGFVTVADNSSTLFSDSFSFSSFGYSSITSLVLTLNYSGVAGYENWFTHAGYGETFATASLPANIGSPIRAYTFDSTSNSSTFSAMVTGKSLNLLFSEATPGDDKFQLNSASLAVTGVPAVPEPETYAMLMVGLGLIGTIACRNKQGHA